MITTNTDKRALIDKLYRDSVITLDQAIQLLEEWPEELRAPSFVQHIYIPQMPVYPTYPSVQPLWPAGTRPWGTICGISTSTANSLPVGTAVSYTSALN
jgi:hypothetical protein